MSEGAGRENGGRVFLFDNVKAAMLVLVAFGHVLDVYMRNGVAEYTLMKYIYLFHMPVFAFVTGYFSKDADKARATAMTRALFPYLLFQGIYILMARAMVAAGLASFNADVFRPSLLLPTSAFYYLLAVFFWKLFLKDLRRFRFPLALSVFLGCAVSLTDCRPFHYGLGAVFGYLPFFVLGAQTGEGAIRAVRRVPRWIWAAVMLAGVPVAYFTPYAIHSVRMTYAACGFGPLEGIAYRLLFYAVAAAMGAAVIGLAPAGKTRVSGIGGAAILVYAGSTFLSPHAYLLFAGPLHLASSRILNLAGMAVFSMVVAVVCSRPAFMRAYRAVLGAIERVLLSGTTGGTGDGAARGNDGTGKTQREKE